VGVFRQCHSGGLQCWPAARGLPVPAASRASAGRPLALPDTAPATGGFGRAWLAGPHRPVAVPLLAGAEHRLAATGPGPDRARPTDGLHRDRPERGGARRDILSRLCHILRRPRTPSPAPDASLCSPLASSSHSRLSAAKGETLMRASLLKLSY